MVPLIASLLGRCKLSPKEAPHSLWGYMMALGVIMEAEDGPDMLLLLASISAQLLQELRAHSLMGHGLHARMRREYHIFTVKKHAD